MKTTKRQFKLFCDEFGRQVQRMGLMEWRLQFIHGYNDRDGAKALAEIDASYQNRTVAVFFATESNIPLSDDFVCGTAKHEAIELLVDDSYTIAQSRFLTIDEVVSTRHTLVRRLEKLL